jgi:hypothetical protein
MAALGAGVRNIPAALPAIVLALLTGLNASAVGLIALAGFKLSKSTVTDRISRLVLFMSAAFGICYQAPWVRCYRLLEPSVAAARLVGSRTLNVPDVSHSSSSRRIHNCFVGLPAETDGPRSSPSPQAQTLSSDSREASEHGAKRASGHGAKRTPGH